MGASLEAMLDQRRAWKGGGVYVPLPASVTRGVTAPNASATPPGGTAPAAAPPELDLRLSPSAQVLVGSSPVPAAQLAISMSDLEDVGALGVGSCSARQVRHGPTGSCWAVKRRPNHEQCANEEAANRIYTALGACMPDTFVVADGEDAYLVQRMLDGQTWQALKQDAASQDRLAAVRQQMGRHFILDCLFANWDVVGMRGGDNVLVDTAGRAFRLDNAGVLGLRAQGGPKHANGWGPAVTELFLMRDPSPDGNASAGDVFKDVSDEEVAEQVQQILQFGDALFSHLAPSDRAVLSQRVHWLKDWRDSRLQNEAPSEMSIMQLVSMGFSQDAAVEALRASGNDPERALLRLTSVAPASPSPVAPESVAQIVAMGFERSAAESALAATGGDVADAVAILTS